MLRIFRSCRLFVAFCLRFQWNSGPLFLPLRRRHSAAWALRECVFAMRTYLLCSPGPCGPPSSSTWCAARTCTRRPRRTAGRRTRPARRRPFASRRTGNPCSIARLLGNCGRYRDSAGNEESMKSLGAMKGGELTACCSLFA